MKTILHVIDTTGPGGAETVFVELASAVAKAGYRSIALIRGPGWVQDTLEQHGIPTFVLECKGSFNLKFLLQLIRLILRERVDVIQSHLLGSNVYCALAGCVSRRPVIASFHGGVDVAANERYLSVKFSVINCFAKSVVAVSNALAQELVHRAGLDAKKIHIIYNGIDTSQFSRPRSQALKRKLSLPEDAILVGALGNIRPAKAYDVLLNAFSIVAQKHPLIHLVIGGEGKRGLQEKLLLQRKELGLEDKVHFMGFVDDPAQYLSSIDIFALSSTSEGFSLATVQAMAASLPVVATKSGGPEEILSDKKTGLLVDRDDPKALASGLQALIEDAGLAARLAAEGYKSALQRFDISSMISAYDSLYR